MDRFETVAEMEGVEVGRQRESVGISLAHAFNGAQGRIRSCEVGQRAVETVGGHHCELLRLSSNNYFIINDRHTADENIEANRDEGGTEVHRRRHCRKEFQGQEVNRFVRRRPKDPQDASYVQRHRFRDAFECTAKQNAHPVGKVPEYPANRLDKETCVVDHNGW